MTEDQAKAIYQLAPAEKQVLETTLLKSAKLINEGVQYPIDSWAREAIHIESPAKCADCTNCKKADKMPSEARYYGYQLE